MTDRELLEFAAKAAKLPIEWRSDYVSVHDFRSEQPRHLKSGYTSYVYGNEWSPLTNDGDAFRLLAMLDVKVQWRTSAVDVTAGKFSVSEHISTWGACGAARRAIVRAAAEIGRSLP